MRTAPITLQDLRRRLYVKAKAEPSWRFWGLYVHVCKRETLWEAYRLARENDGAPGIDGVTFEAIEAGGVEGFLEELRKKLDQRTYRPLRARKVEIPKAGGVRQLSILPFATGWSRVRSSLSWSQSSRRTSNRGHMATGRSGQHTRRSNAYRKPFCALRPMSSTFRRVKDELRRRMHDPILVQGGLAGADGKGLFRLPRGANQ